MRVGGVEVAGVGLGSLGMGVHYPTNPPPPLEPWLSAAVSLPRPVLLDTADVYCRDRSSLGALESQIAQFLSSSSSSPHPPFHLATKGGAVRTSDGTSSSSWAAPLATPSAVVAAVSASASRLGSPLWLWQSHHAPDHTLVPIMLAVQHSALATHLGVCNVSVPAVERLIAAGVRLTTVQNEFSPWVRTAATPLKPGSGGAGGRTGMLDYCAKNGLVFLAYSPFGGLKTRRAERNLDTDFPHFTEAAARKQCTSHALLLAVMRKLWPHCIPLVGTRSPDRVRQLLDYEKIELSAEEAQDLWDQCGSRSKKKKS